ncbi:mitochondrial PGP phosphatase, partial [Russula emetica]
MPLNFPATLVSFYALLNPRLLPSDAVRDVRYLNFAILRDAGYRGVIFDKDNCLVISHLALVHAAWSEVVRIFGPLHVLVVSNSAGTRDDAAQLQAKSVSHHLHAPVLLPASLKPSHSCTTAALSTLPGIAPYELIIVGD